MSIRAKYFGLQQEEIAAQVAERWGNKAPFPSQPVRLKYFKWRRYAQEVERLLEVAAKPKCKRISTVHRNIETAVRKRDRLKVPVEYSSWDHVAAFMEALALREEQDALHFSPEPDHAIRERAA